MLRKIAQKIGASYYRSVERFVEEPQQVQELTLDYLLAHGRKTSFGQEHRFDLVKNRDHFRDSVPVSSYETLRPYLDRIIVGKESGVLWDTPTKWFAMSSGTTQDKSKYIPVTEEALHGGHLKAGHQMIGIYAYNNPDTAFLLGKSVALGGSQQINSIGKGIFTGDISAILLHNLPFWSKYGRPPQEVALIPDWEEKLDAITKYSLNKDVRSLVGVPSWTLVLLKKIVAETGRSITDIWPNLEVFFHGGVSFTAFEEQYRKIIPKDDMRYWETYNSSEGFFGVQWSKESKDLVLLLDNQVYYEFLPSGEWGKDNPKTLMLDEVTTGKQYALVITTSSGLWRYVIGDTIEFTSLHPFLFRITGRTKHFINAFGEELIVDNADRALLVACEKTGAKVSEYTAAPIYFGDNSNGAHEWLIEFEVEPNSIDEFTLSLDSALKNVNSDYEAKRSHNLSLGMPVVRSMENGTFYRWLKSKGKAGGQNKVPRLSNNREIVESILNLLSSDDKKE